MHGEFSTTLSILGEGELLIRDNALLAKWGIWDGENRGTHARARSPGMPARVHDVCIEWSTRIGSSPLHRYGLLLQFCFIAENSDFFFRNTLNNPVRETAWSPNKLRASYPVWLHWVEIVHTPWSSVLISLYQLSHRLHATRAKSI